MIQDLPVDPGCQVVVEQALDLVIGGQAQLDKSCIKEFA